MACLRHVKAPVALIFFEPVQVHGQLANLLMQRGDEFLLILVLTAIGIKHIGQMFPEGGFPLTDLNGMDVVLAGDLSHGFDADERIQRNLGLEGRTMSFSFCFHDFCFFPIIADSQNPNLAPGPVFGIQLSCANILRRRWTGKLSCPYLLCGWAWARLLR